MKNILKDSFWQLILIYTAVVILVGLGFLSKHALQFNIFAVAVGLMGAFSLNKSKEYSNNKGHFILLGIALILIILIRITPYFFTSIPLGYDPGIYKYGIEHGLANKDPWILKGGMEPGFLYLMQPFKLLFSTDFILKYLLIFFCVLLGFAVYLVSKEYFNKRTAIISIFIYALSIIQFKTFWYLYYKNIIDMAMMLFSFYFLKRHNKNKYNKWFFILFGALTGAIHRPTFYIFGLSYFAYAFVSPYQNKRYDKPQLKENILSGVLIALISLLFYIKDFLPAITYLLPWVAKGFVDTGLSPGTFLDFTTYQYSILAYSALAVLGLVFSIKKKVGILEIWALLNLAIVYFQFFFFNRFIIMLDLVLILFAGYGFNLLIENKKKVGTLIVILLLLAMGVLALKESFASKPLIDDTELQVIQAFQITPNNSFVMSTSSYYSTWIQGYSERKTIAPGLFDYDNNTKEEWGVFWSTNNLTEVTNFLNKYPKPLYIFIGKRQKDNLKQFPSCLSPVISEENNTIYQYLC